MKRAMTLTCLSVLSLGIVGCRQSDAALAARVDSALAADDSVGAVRLTVTSSERAITLSGRVEGQEVRRRAVRLARQTAGVVDVIDRLVILPLPAPVGTPAPTGQVMGHGRERH